MEVRLKVKDGRGTSFCCLSLRFDASSLFARACRKDVARGLPMEAREKLLSCYKPFSSSQ